MRIVEVIGSVTLSKCHPSLEGARWLVAVPYSLAALADGKPADGEDLVVYDELGAGTGCRVGISEGTEASMPFRPDKKPVDAYAACILDEVRLEPGLREGA
jgi:microcompartment protein CcmK/EutM